MIRTENTNARAAWAEKITATYKAGVMGLLQIGVQLAAAKEALSREDYAAMVETDLPFDARMAQIYVKVGSSERFAKCISSLPAAISTLYELSKIDERAFEQFVKKGRITPAMERKEAFALYEEVKEAAQRSRPSTAPSSSPSAPTPSFGEAPRPTVVLAPSTSAISRPSAPSLFHELTAYLATIAAFTRRADAATVAHGAQDATSIKPDLGAVRSWLADLDEVLGRETIDQAAE